MYPFLFSMACNFAAPLFDSSERLSRCEALREERVFCGWFVLAQILLYQPASIKGGIIYIASVMAKTETRYKRWVILFLCFRRV